MKTELFLTRLLATAAAVFIAGAEGVFVPALRAQDAAANKAPEGKPAAEKDATRPLG
jgi:hypothetical protein